MGYRFNPDDIAFLRSHQGEQALTLVANLQLSSTSMLADINEIRRRYSPYDAALIEVTRCRRRARAKLRHADELLLDDESLQQATASVVAAHRAAEIAERFGQAVVHDVTCSIGAELIELAAQRGIGGVIGSDLDRDRLMMAQHNTALESAPRPTLLRADALTACSRADVIIADPARRTGSGRVFRLEQLSPPLPEVLATYRDRPLIVKCAPGLDYQLLRQRYGFVGEVQVTSLDSAVREACLWTGPGLPARRRATVLRTGVDGAISRYDVTSDEPDDTDAAPPGDFIIDPDGAIVRAGLVRHYARRHDLWQLDPQIAYLTGNSVPKGERGFRILEQLASTNEKVLRKALAGYDCRTLEILVRGLDQDPDALRKRLKLSGSRSLALVLTRIGRKACAFICESGTRNI